MFPISYFQTAVSHEFSNLVIKSYGRGTSAQVNVQWASTCIIYKILYLKIRIQTTCIEQTHLYAD